MATCCPSDAWGKLPPEVDEDYSPQGSTIELRDVDLKTYVATPKLPTHKGLIVIEDVGVRSVASIACPVFYSFK